MHSSWPIVLLFTVWLFKGADAKCNSTNSVIFDPIPEEQYSREYAEISDNSARPLGFKKFVVKYNNPPKPVCVAVQNTAGRGIEVMFETNPRALLCFRDKFGEHCSQPEGTFRSCHLAEDEMMFYDFYYDISMGSSQSDINFWLRIITGPENDQDLAWCHTRRNELPRSLLGLNPNDVRIPPSPTEQPNSGPTFHYNMFVLICAVVCSITFLMPAHQKV